jgi:hypothetical protein
MYFAKLGLLPGQLEPHTRLAVGVDSPAISEFVEHVEAKSAFGARLGVRDVAYSVLAVGRPNGRTSHRRKIPRPLSPNSQPRPPLNRGRPGAL